MRGIKQMLAEQEVVVGPTVLNTFTPWVAKLYADAGADFVYVESEHSMFNAGEVSNFVLSCRLCGLPVVAKSPYVDRGATTRLLDAGITGIQLPMSESAEQLAEVVSYTKFPPIGVRAVGPGIGCTDYEPVDMKKWLKQTNEETTVIAHIESRPGLENVDKILSVEHVDIMFIGMLDLTVSLGQPGNFEHPDVVKAVEHLIGAAKEHGKIAGMWAPSFNNAKDWINKGVRFFESASDVSFIAAGATGLIKQFPGHRSRVSAGQGHV